MAFVRNLKPSRLSWAHYKQQTIIFNTWNRAIALPVSSVVLSGNDTVKSFADLPGPVNLPVVGTSWSFLVGKKGESLGKRILSVQRDHVNKYVNILKQSLAGHTMVEIADPADVTKVLRSEAKYPQRFEFPILDYYREKRQKIPGVFFADGPEWYKLRSVLSKRMLRPKQVADYASGFNDIITDFVYRLRSVREPKESAHAYEVSELDNELFKWSFESVAEMLFDKRFGCLEPQVNEEAQIFIKAVGDFLHNAVVVGFLPVWFYKIYETQQFKEFSNNFDIMYKYAELFIERRIKELKAKPHDSTRLEDDKEGFFEYLLSSGKLTIEDLLACVIDVLFAGVDTTSNTMQWVLYMMAKHPNRQEILRHEVISVLGNETIASPTDLSQMPYLKAWVRETLRLYPVLSALFRILPTDMVLSGYNIPAGTQVNVLAYYMSRDESIFKDAHEFQPERWLRDKEPHSSKFIDSKEVFSSTPFGFGTRMCLGRRIAELELHLLLARIVQQFDIRYPPDADDVQPYNRGVTIPDRPLRVQFVDRTFYSVLKSSL